MHILAVWMNGERVGTWQVGRTGHHVFEYAPSWYQHPKCRPLSLSLPLTANRRLEGEVVKNYFDNLLPDNEAIRKRLRTRFKLPNTQAFTLLEAIGRDCVGAAQLLPVTQTAPTTQKLEYKVLNSADVSRVLASLGENPGAGPEDDDEFRISIAGAQEKTALLKVGEQWCLPLNATPTTHILKPPIGITPGRELDLQLSPENEWLCSRILHALGLPVAHCWVEPFQTRRALVVERFDRQWQDAGQSLIRVPQEDFCQVLGKSSTHKYENEGGPGIQDCLQVLKGSTAHEQDTKVFLLAQLAFWLLAAIDGHAKNFSVFLLPGGAYRLTPLYDVMSAWPLIGNGPRSLAYQKAKLAMAIKGSKTHYRLSEIQPRHWQALANRSGVPGMWAVMQALVQRVPSTLSQVSKELPPTFPDTLIASVFQGMQHHADKFLQQMEKA